MADSLLTILEEKGVDRAFADLGLDVERLFPKDKLKDNLYADHIWKVVRVPGWIIINAVPPVEKQDTLFWEEWYLHEGKVFHHILSLWKPASYTEIFHAPQHDDVHPPEVFGKNWYVIDDPDMRPYLYR
ncbi:MAG TPA: hypothetical protein PLG43_08125 [Spirochaetia bacterium]|nr:hypothetical protein [Spirochaetia bacterium]